MAFTDGFKLLEHFQNFRLDDVPHLLKTTQQMQQNASFVQWFEILDSEMQIDFIHKAVCVYCHALTSAKLARAFLKLLGGLPKNFQSVVEREIKESFESVVSRASNEDDIKIVCVMLDQNNIAKKMCFELLSPISCIVRDQLVNIHTHENKVEESCDMTYYVLKICILCLQLNSGTIKRALEQTTNDDADISPEKELSCLWQDILSNLLTLLLQGFLNRDLLFLVGTAVAMVTNLLPSCDETVNMYVGVINMIKSDQAMISIGNIVVHKPKSSSAVDFTLPLLSVIKGVLVSAPRYVLCHPTERKSLLLFLFTHIIATCQGPSEHHYVAFQVFLLWFGKLIATGNHVVVPSNVIETSLEGRKATFSDISNRSIEGDSKDTQRYSGTKVLGHETKMPWRDEEDFPVQTQLNAAGDSALFLPVSSDTSSSARLMSRSCPILSSTLSCLWLNWDSPVDDVSEYVLNIFHCILKLWSQSVHDGLSDYSELSLDLMDRVMAMVWHSKTRYRPMSALLPHLNIMDVLVRFPELKNELMRCMAMNHMAAVASDVYKIFLTKITEERTVEDHLSIWTQTWMDKLLFGLTSSNSLQRMKICTYWLPLTLKIIAGSADVLLEEISGKYNAEHFSSRTKWLFAWITVFKTARDLLQPDLPLKHEKFVTEALTSFDEAVRSEVLMLICGTLKKAEPVSQKEILWLKSFLPINLRTDSTPFRQCLTSAIKKFIVRIRDSCLSAIRTRRTSEMFLSPGIDFIDWLFKLLIHGLTPGGSYHRRQTTLNMLEVVLESLIHQSNDHSRKGKAPENSHILLEFAQGKGMWDFFSISNLSSLLMCLEDGAEEIQMQSYKILTEYFQWPASFMVLNNVTFNDSHEQCVMKNDALSSFFADDSTICHLFQKALELMSSPKSYENHGGQLIMCLIVKKFLKVLRIKVGFEEELVFDFSSLIICVTKLDGKDENDHDYIFINFLLQIVKKSLSEVKKDIARQFKLHIIHGITQCISKCTELILCDERKNRSPDWISLLEDIVSLNQDIILLVLDVLAGGKNQGDCPSFADMGMALEGLISSDLDDLDNHEDVATLSPEFQLLLSWCWINLKNSCSCLSEITSCAIQGMVCLLSPSIITSIGELYVKVLTTCRHRGAIEGCRSGFLKLCTALLSSKIREFLDIPEKILEDILQSLSTNSLTASISRRSAGLPIIIQTIVSVEIKTRAKKNVLLATVQQLYDVASEPLPADYSQQRDLAQSHALNVLKAIFCEASLSSHLMPHLSKITILVIKGFDSPSWAIRNAATQLISTLMTRIFGQKNSEQGRMTLEEFHHAFPDLHDFASEKLQMYSSSTSLINPSLYLILTLFSNLAMSPSHQHSEDAHKTLQQIMLAFTSSPLYSLRKLSAQAYVRLCPLDQVDESIRLMMARLAEPFLNAQHGYLLCMHYLVSTGFVSNTVAVEVLDFLSQNHFNLGGRLEASSFTIATVMMILKGLLENLNEKLDGVRASKLWSQVTFHILSLGKASSSVQLGNSYAMTESLKTLSIVTSLYQPLYPQTVQFLCTLSTSLIEDVRHSFLLCVSIEEGNRFLEDHSIQMVIVKNLTQEGSASVFTQSCQLLTGLQLQQGSKPPSSWQSAILDFDTGEALSRLGNTNSVNLALFLLEGIIICRIGQGPQLCDRLPLISKCCQKLIEFSNPRVNEDQRLTAARFLRIAGKTILDQSIAFQNDAEMEEAAVSIIKSLLSLLQDTESDVRNETASFISELIESAVVHADLAWELLLEVICEKLWWSSSLTDFLTQILFSSKELTSALQSVAREQRLFEPETESTMSEPYTLKLWTFRLLKGLFSNSKSETLLFLTSACSMAFNELNENLLYLKDNTQERHFFNLTGKTGILSALLGIVLIDKLCQGTHTPIGQSAQDFHMLVKELLQISGIHPMLKNCLL